MFSYITRILLLTTIGLLSLSACSKQKGAKDLQEFVKTEKRKPIEEKVLIPEIQLSNSVTYQAAGLRSPFEQLIEKAGAGPLTYYSLGDLKFIGTLKSGEKWWAAVLLPDGKIYDVTVGDPIGQRDGRVVSISEEAIVVSEMEESAGQQKQQLVTLRLQAAVSKLRK